MVGSYQTITYKRYAVQSATKFKAKIVDIPFCDPESGFSILVASRIEDGKSIVLKGIIPNPVENAYITYQGHWEQDTRRGTQYVKVESCKIDYEAGGTDSIYELLTSGYVPGVGPVTAKKIIKAFGTDSLKIIEKSPEKLTELAGIKENIHIAKDQELISFLLPFISMQKINAVLKEYGDSKQALAAIKENPYCLYQDVSGIGFAASDRIALVGLGMEIRTTALLNYFYFVRKYGEVNDLDNRHAEDGIRKGVRNVCLLTPVRKKGSGYISATDLNLLIRDKLNPATYENSGFIESLKGVPEQGFDYRIGDRVMLCKNHRGSFVNGDMGFITSFEPKALDQDGAMICNAYTVRFDNPCDVDGECFEMIVSRKTMQSEFALAYAMTVHKSQGSEFKAVVVAFDTGWKQLQQRNLLYTAVTRSKNECRIVGNMDAVDVAIDTNDIENRNSLLKNRLQHYNNEKYLDIHMTNFGTSGTDCFAE